MEHGPRPAGNGWQSLPARLAHRARHDPDRSAVDGTDGSLTYRELVARAAVLQDRLVADGGVRAGDLVAVRLERTADMVAWLVAILATGAAYVPIDPDLPPSRAAQMLEDARPVLLLASRSLLAGLPGATMPVMVADERGAIRPACALALRCGPDDLAYLLYTSGSTGRPKGVEIQHGALSAFLDAVEEVGFLGAGERLLAISRLSFDMSVMELMLPLWVGGTVTVLPAEEVVDPRRLATAIFVHRPKVVQATPATWRSLLGAGWKGLPGLRILCGGEAMTRDLATQLLPRCQELWNCYGPTETTVWSAAHRVGAGNGPVPVGRPLDGTTIRLVDAALAPVDDGAIGEILIAGPSTARGYRGMPDLTAARFVAPDGGVRAYRTGDLGRLDADGLLVCLGRMDDQVKIRGFRIELGDVEHALAAHPGIAWSAARTWTDPGGETALVAYVVPRDGNAIPVARIAAFLGESLPRYMVPSRVVTLDRMPLTLNGKVDRNALADPFAGIAHPAPVDGGEGTVERLGAIWKELLGIREVAGSDDFFDLGGYSLITVKLLCRIEEMFNRSLEIQDLIGASSLARMAALVEAEPTGGARPFLLNHPGSRPPLHWMDAGPLIRGVARAMPGDQPVLGLNLSRAEERGFAEGPLDLAEVAAVLRHKLLAVQPTGPLYIGGWCRWAIVAHELACQLRTAGHEVALLVNLDSTAPAHGLTGLASKLRDRIGARRSVAVPRSFGERVELASRNQALRRFDGDGLLLRPGDERRGPGEHGWRALIGGTLTVDHVPGTHESMMRGPHAAVLGAIIARRLAERQAARSPASAQVAAGALPDRVPHQAAA